VTATEVVVRPDQDRLAADVSARLLAAVAAAQAERGVAHVVLTGGSMGNATLAAVAADPGRDTVDWGLVHLWWGDERFVPATDDDRNEKQARAALLDRLVLDPAKVHAMPASDGDLGDDVDAAAADYARELADAAEGSAALVPAFDVLMLGVGPDGHVASLFPGHPGADVSDETAIAVRHSPKPPPVRISLTLPAIDAARQVWLLAAGEGKADAVAGALDAARTPSLPAGRVRGTEATVWLLDQAAAAGLGPGQHS
jgi:6-phosphogluconolactonase